MRTEATTTVAHSEAKHLCKKIYSYIYMSQHIKYLKITTTKVNIIYTESQILTLPNKNKNILNHSTLKTF